MIIWQNAGLTTKTISKINHLPLSVIQSIASSCHHTYSKFHQHLEADPDENERICRDEEENTNEYTQKGWNKSRNRNTKNEIIKIY